MAGSCSVRTLATCVLLILAASLPHTRGGAPGHNQVLGRHHSLGGHGRSLIGSTQPWVEPISWSPRAFLYHHFLSEAEADHVKGLAYPFMKRSTVVGAGGQSVEDNIRTSYGTFLRRLQDEVVTRIEERVAQWTKLNVSHQEDIQVLRYGLGQKYGAHYDSLDNDSPRVATVLLFLSDVEEGGETAFPLSDDWLDESLPQRFQELRPFSSCAAGHVAVHPRKGDALLFYSLKVDGEHDPASMHAGCPVLKGIKWTATKWIHTKPFRPESLGKLPKPEDVMLPEDCRDKDEECEDWARRGECKKNAKFMIGDYFALGACRAACGECEVCTVGDRECMNRNRVRAGYLPLEELGDEPDTSDMFLGRSGEAGEDEGDQSRV